MTARPPARPGRIVTITDPDAARYGVTCTQVPERSPERLTAHGRLAARGADRASRSAKYCHRPRRPARTPTASGAASPGDPSAPPETCGAPRVRGGPTSRVLKATRLVTSALSHRGRFRGPPHPGGELCRYPLPVRLQQPP
ncbi:hypothetical protein CRV15_01660 [Streptomyces clavuligerus]|uniref:Uncharacterized protein n=1 Tax=Streptomyces clavuligerus TaxID=1901 RepID=B5GYG6_STRCL|nr:hypothetical protein D1794_01665 [Streptomyces clavuligerus]EDY51362.1 hypothetical protein SSCG_04520 [Streptomyces clavuligerus]EFG10454.1 Hypothetical protein SCLAV_5387 [Streptomyces clavuligerus]QCS04416.1 hypothetical protein CRV15_01660 [Streptomyces clavuligerus]QPJ96201.1 hypothetical protein GE265_26210 [Streptomyces clavuligerus]